MSINNDFTRYHQFWIFLNFNLGWLGLTKGSSINYVSTFEGGGGIKMLMVADVGEGGVSDLLMSAKIIHI